MKRIITLLALLAVMVWLGCEKLESPSSPSQDKQAQPAAHFDAEASVAKLEENVQALQAKVEERAAALKTKAATFKQQHQMPHIAAAADSKITVPDDYPTIQQAVNAASPGTKILVKDGTYSEEVSVFTDNLTLTSAHKGQAHVIGSFGIGGVTKGTIEGFDITGEAFLEECTKVEIKENEVKGGSGIVLYASVDCVVKDNKVHDNKGFAVGGINIFLGGKHLVKGNICQNNSVGIIVSNGPSPGKNVISFNECTGNFGGIRLFGSQENTLRDNKCNFNVFEGIGLTGDSDHNKIGPNNKAKHNGDVGILFLLNVDNNTVIKNIAKDNANCDIIDRGIGNTFIKNTFGTFCP